MEEDFPRGGSDSGAVAIKKKEVGENREKHASEIGAKKKRSLTKGSKDPRKPEKDLDSFKGKLPKYVETIRFKSLTVGTKLLAVVSELNSRGIIMSLPNGMKGLVSYPESFDIAPEGKASMLSIQREILPVGTTLPCVVVGLGSKQLKNAKVAKRIDLSIRLSRLHEGMGVDHFQEGMVSWAFVKSIEDHGYILGFGVPSVSGFLLFKDQKDGKERGQLKVGQLVQCLLGSKEKKTETIRCKLDPKLTSAALVSDFEGLTLQNLVPGQLVMSKVQSVLSDGLTVSFLTYFSGTVNRLHLESPLSPPDWQTKFNPGFRARACIIMVDPVSKSVSLTLNSSLVSGKLPNLGCELGQVFDGAVVCRVDPSLGLLLNLTPASEGTPAFVHVSDVAEDRVEKLEKKFKVGQEVKARVIGSRLLDGVAVATMRESVVQQLLLRLDDVHPGMLVHGKILSLQPFGAIVALADGIHALCPLFHMAESKVSKIPSKFKEGASLKFRVLTVDLESKRITVTHKKTLVSSKLAILASVVDATVGTVSHGWISGVQDFGVFVCFYGGLKGLAHRSQLGIERDTVLSKVFSEGQVVKCRILREPDTKGNLNLSFVTSGDIAAEPLPVEEVIGKIVQGTVTSVVTKGFLLDLRLEGSSVKGFLPRGHLADSAGQAEALAELIKPGQVLDRLVVLHADKHRKLVVSGKFSLLAANLSLPSKLEQLKHGEIIPAFISNVSSHGCFVQFLGGLTGLAPLAHLTDTETSTPSDLFQVLQSVRARVMNVNEETKRFTVNLKQSACASTDSTLIFGYFMADRMVAEWQAVRDGTDLQWAASFKVGTLVVGEVQAVKDYGVILSLEENKDVVGFATHYHCGGSVSVGDKVKGVVLDIGLCDGIVDVSLRSELVDSLTADVIVNSKKRKKGAAKQQQNATPAELEPGTQVDAVVQLVKDEYLVLSLPKLGSKITFAAAKDFNFLYSSPHERFNPGEWVAATVCSSPEDWPAAALPNRQLVIVDVTKPSVLEQQLLPAGNGLESEGGDGMDPGRVESSPALSAHAHRSLDALAVGQPVTAVVQSVSADWVLMTLPSLEGVQARLFVLDSSLDPLELQQTPSRFQPGQSVPVFVAEKEEARNRVRVLLSPPTLEDPEPFHVAPGQLRAGRVAKLPEGGQWMVVQLAPRTFGRVFLTDVSDYWWDKPLEGVHVGLFVRCKVLSALNQTKIRLSLWESLGGCGASQARQLAPAPENQRHDGPHYASLSELAPGMLIWGYVKLCSKKGCFVSLAHDVEGVAQLSGKLEEVQAAFPSGKLVQGRVIAVDEASNRIELNLEAESDGQEVEDGEAAGLDNEGGEGWAEEGEEVDTVGELDAARGNNMSSVAPLTVDLDDGSPQAMEATENEAEQAQTEEVGKQKKKRAKKRDRDEREATIQAAEEARLLGDTLPQTEDDFERLVVANPDSSFLWIKFMAFLLSQSEVGKARAVAERALSTIQYREEQEKLNVWVAYLNLENMSADQPKEAVWSLFQRGLQYCDPKKLHLALLGIYERTEQNDMTDNLLRIMTRKFKTSAKVWLRQVQALLKRGQDEPAHKTMERGLLSLPNRKHIKLITRVALLDYKLGFPERGRMMFENVLRNFPKRTDIWSQYIDQEAGLEDQQRVRGLYERATCLDLPVKKMKFLFKKYLDFEKEKGDQGRVEAVKARAMAFVEAKMGH